MSSITHKAVNVPIVNLQKSLLRIFNTNTLLQDAIIGFVIAFHHNFSWIPIFMWLLINKIINQEVHPQILALSFICGHLCGLTSLTHGKSVEVVPYTLCMALIVGRLRSYGTPLSLLILGYVNSNNPYYFVYMIAIHCLSAYFPNDHRVFSTVSIALIAYHLGINY
jgi:hypothetical protein